MPKRSYNQNCVLARAGDVIGERWTLLLLRDLFIAPRRYGDLLDSLRGIGTNLLAARLKELDDAGLLERTEMADGASGYALTANGRALEPAILALIRWSMLYGPPNQPGDFHRDDWDLLALKALFQPDLAKGLTMAVQFVTEDFSGWVAIEKGEMRIGLGEAEEADVIVAGTVPELFLGTRGLDERLVRGERSSVEQFMSAFAG